MGISQPLFRPFLVVLKTNTTEQQMNAENSPFFWDLNSWPLKQFSSLSL